MTAPRLDRLAPVLAAMIALLAGAVATELGLRDRQAPAREITISHDVDTEVHGGDEGDDTEGGGAIDDDGAPLDDVHARARLLAHRGDVAGALPLFAQVAAAHPADGHVLAELGYWQLVLDQPGAARATLERARTLLPDEALIALNLGIAAARSGDPATGEAELRRALAIEPRYGSARVALGRLLRRTGRLDEAIVELEAAAASGGNEERARALVSLGRAYLAAGRAGDADRALTRAVELAPASADLRLGVARAYLASGRDGDVARATAVLEEALRIAPEVPALLVALGRAREKTRDAAAAEDAYERALRLDPAYHYARRRLLRIALDREDFPGARLHAEYLLRDASEIAEHHFLAGLVAARDGRRDDARRHYADAVARADGGYPEAWFNLGLLERDADRLDEAIAAYRQALASRPDYVAALNNLGLVLDDAGRGDEAEAAFRGAIAADSGYAPAWLNLGNHLADARRWDEAIAALNEALAARPGYPRARHVLVSVLRKAGRIDEAIATAESLVADEPRYVPAWVGLGTSLIEGGRLADAERALRRAIDLDEDHAGARRGLASVLAREGRASEALVQYEELLDRVPGDRAGRLAHAELELAGGDRAGCARDARLVLARDPHDAEARRLAAACAAP